MLQKVHNAANFCWFRHTTLWSDFRICEYFLNIPEHFINSCVYLDTCNWIDGSIGLKKPSCKIVWNSSTTQNIYQKNLKSTVYFICIFALLYLFVQLLVVWFIFFVSRLFLWTWHVPKPWPLKPWYKPNREQFELLHP